MTHLHHSFDYVELACGDLGATKAFYTDVFGWDFTDYGPAYAGIRAPDGDGEVGGLDAGAAPASGHPLVVLWSEDLDATATALESAGAVLTVPVHAFPGGRRLQFRDPAGNELGVWTASEEMPPEGP